jgi:hypothetical protein
MIISLFFYTIQACTTVRVCPGDFLRLRLDIGNGNKLYARIEHTITNCLCVYVQNTVKNGYAHSLPRSSCYAERAVKLSSCCYLCL